MAEFLRSIALVHSYCSSLVTGHSMLITSCKRLKRSSPPQGSSRIAGVVVVGGSFVVAGYSSGTLVNDCRHVLNNSESAHIAGAIASYRLVICNFHDRGSTFVELVQHRNLPLRCITTDQAYVDGRFVAILVQQAWSL